MSTTETQPGTPDIDPSAAQFADGNEFMRAGRFAEAAAAYRRSLALNRAAPRTHNNLAVALAEQGRYGSALAHYREAIRLDPDYAPTHYNFANACRALAKYAEAVGAEKNIKLDTSSMTYVDSAFVGLTILLQGYQKRQGRRLLVDSPSENVRRVIRYCCAEYLCLSR